MINEPDLIAKQSNILFIFNKNTSSYQSQLSLLNRSQQPLYYRIVSTFGKLLSHDDQMIKKLQPHKSTILNMKLKIPNQIKKTQQIIRISSSKRQISSKICMFDDPYFDVLVSFEQNLPQQDQMITQILKADCIQLCQQGADLLYNGFVKKALYKYQQSFLLYRQLGSGLYGMAQCLYLMESWHEALNQIQTALILHNDESYLWLKLKIVFQILKDELNSLPIIRQLKNQIKKITQIKNIQQKKKQMVEYLTREQQKLVAQKGGKYVSHFIQKALQKYQQDTYLKTLYKNYSDYEKQVLQIMQVKKPHTIQQAPQYILDPITYQIMQNPIIVPSGHSFQQKSILAYLSKHGNKDLFTRQQLRYQWSKPNTALQSYIKKNQHLKKWIEFQKEISTFK